MPIDYMTGGKQRMEITKKDFENYRQLKRHIEILNERLKYFRDKPKEQLQDTVKGSDRNYPYTEKRYHLTGIDGVKEKDNNNKIKELKKILKEKKKEAEEKEIEIEYFINQIDDVQIKNIFYLYYINGYSMNVIADEMNITRPTVSKIISRYFDNYFIN